MRISILKDASQAESIRKLAASAFAAQYECWFLHVSNRFGMRLGYDPRIGKLMSGVFLKMQPIA